MPTRSRLRYAWSSRLMSMSVSLPIAMATCRMAIDISITEMEYNRAVELRKPRLIFFIHEDHPVKTKDVETGAGAAETASSERSDRQSNGSLAFFKSRRRPPSPRRRSADDARQGTRRGRAQRRRSAAAAASCTARRRSQQPPEPLHRPSVHAPAVARPCRPAGGA